MDDVLAGDQQTHFDPGRKHQRVIHAQQVVRHRVRIDARLQLPRVVAVARQRGEHADAGADVFVTPLPLVTGDADRQLRAAGILGFDQYPSRRDGHADQDQHRHDGPHHFHSRAMQQLRVGHGSARLAETHHGKNHEAEHRDGDADAPPEHQHVQIVDLLRQGADARGHVQRPRSLRAGCREHHERRCQGYAHPRAIDRRSGHYSGLNP